MLKKIMNRLMVVFAMVCICVMFALPAWAVGTADTAVVDAMTSLSDNVVATIAAIAPVVIAIFAAVVVWKIGKKVFNIIAR